LKKYEKNKTTLRFSRSHPLVNVIVRIGNMKELQSIRYSAENRNCTALDGTSAVW